MYTVYVEADTLQQLTLCTYWQLQYSTSGKSSLILKYTTSSTPTDKSWPECCRKQWRWLQGLNTPVVCLKNLINSYMGQNWSCHTIFSYVPCIESYTNLSKTVFPKLMYMTNAAVTVHCTRSHMHNCCTVSTNALSGKHSYSSTLARAWWSAALCLVNESWECCNSCFADLCHICWQSVGNGQVANVCHLYQMWKCGYVYNLSAYKISNDWLLQLVSYHHQSNVNCRSPHAACILLFYI